VTKPARSASLRVRIVAVHFKFKLSSEIFVWLSFVGWVVSSMQEVSRSAIYLLRDFNSK
jgi:hypothetical protein